jgi:hypothetical protein
MHRPLPDRPSLEYLKHEAKDLLTTLRQQAPDARLAQAQHALARQYGFASWPRLRRHVEGAARSASPFAGAWKANLPDSTPHPAQRFRGATLEFSVRDNVLTIGQVLIDESGQEERSRTALHVDGCEHGSDDRPGLSLVATWRGSHAFRVVATQDGKIVGSGIYEVSADGRRLTVTTDDMHLVFEREAPPQGGRDATTTGAHHGHPAAGQGGHHG